ncbi:phosphotransferase [Halobacillus sp. B23F22_1]|uniref:phosphotransferase n=1 Tax=Halobacillus sp. B23F22_1 TaxID=3459514 RepID=UPI00373F79F8
MTPNLNKGDSYTDRLFKWLGNRKDLHVKKMVEIKPKIYKIWVGDRCYLLKGYRRSNILLQQIDFFQNWNHASELAARPSKFPTGEKSVSKLGCEWGLFEWIEGRHADFNEKEDRLKVYSCLRKFHRTSEGIEMMSIPRDPLYIKWERRLEQFKTTQEIFISYNKKTFFEEVYTTTERLLYAFSLFQWGEMERDAWEKHQWLHGDVAHHNFIVDTSNRVKMIDFDLLHVGPKVYDEIQLAHRFLPFLEDKKTSFFKLFHQVEFPQIWLSGILVPADLIREWLYGYNKYRRGDGSLSSHLDKFEEAWLRRKPFVRYTEFMLR